jgi:hypothetical protein
LVVLDITHDDFGGLEITWRIVSFAGTAPISNLSPADDGAGDVSDTVMVLHEILVTVALALMVIW